MNGWEWLVFPALGSVLGIIIARNARRRWMVVAEYRIVDSEDSSLHKFYLDRKGEFYGTAFGALKFWTRRGAMIQAAEVQLSRFHPQDDVMKLSRIFVEVERI